VRFALSEAMVAVQLRHKRWREKAVDGFLERKASSWSPSFVLLIPIRLRDHLHSLVSACLLYCFVSRWSICHSMFRSQLSSKAKGTLHLIAEHNRVSIQSPFEFQKE
jgi:hypothetical protein